MTDEQIINSLKHLAGQKYLRVAGRSVCKNAADRIGTLAGKLGTANNLDIMTHNLIYSDFADLIISYRLKGTIEDCFAYLEQMGDIYLKDHEWQLSDYQDNINMIRGCIQVLQWFTTDNYDHELAEVNKYSLSIGGVF